MALDNGVASISGPPRRVITGRRALAGAALCVCVLSLASVILVWAGTPDVAPGTRGADAVSDPSAHIPRLCSACGAGAPPWNAPGIPPIIAPAGSAALVSPDAVAAAALEAPPDRRFGVVEAFRAPYAASYAGVGWERLSFNWSSLQPNGPRSWNAAAVSGALIAREIAAGREIVGIIEGRPHWALDARGLPRGLYLPPDDPHNVWASFVAALVRRYRGRIRHWIVWNEPDVWDARNGGYTWAGSVDDFARLQKVAYVRIKGVDPTLVVHLAATTYWWDYSFGRRLYFDRLLDALGRDPQVWAHHWYFDVASAHVYNVPDDVERILLLDRQLMRAHGIARPIWLVETNAMPTRDGPWAMIGPHWMATAAEQAAYVVQASALALAAGAERISFYKMADPAHLSPRAYPVGLVRPDGSARPVLAALRATSHAFAGWTGARDLGTWGGVRAVMVSRGTRGATLVVWNTTPDPLTVTVMIPTPGNTSSPGEDGRIAVVGDDDTRMAPSVSVSGQRAVLRITLAGSTCARSGTCRIGGAPVMVVAPRAPVLQGV